MPERRTRGERLHRRAQRRLTQFPAVIYSSPILREAAAVGLRGIIVDVTERKQTEAALRRSERRFRETLENIALIAVQVDVEGRVTFSNRYLAELTGWSPEELLGRDWLQTMIPPRLRGRIARDFFTVARTIGTVPEYYENPIVTRSGAERLVAWSNSVIHDEDGRLVGMTTIGQDITQLKQAEAALRSSEEKYRTVVEAAREGIGIVDPDENILFVNSAYAEMLGYETGELLGRNLRELTDEKQFEMYLNETEKRRTGESSQYETMLRHRSGEPKWCIVSASPLYDDAGSFAGTLGLLTDITERKKSEEKMQQAQRIRAEAENLAATGRMAAHVAHEINNPLAGIKNSFRLIKDAVPKDHPDYDMVGRIEREIDRIAHVVRQMYKLHSPRAETPTGVPVEGTIRDVLAMLESLCREHDVTIELGQIPPRVESQCIRREFAANPLQPGHKRNLRFPPGRHGKHHGRTGR